MDKITIEQCIIKISQLDTFFEQAGLKRDNAMRLDFEHGKHYRGTLTISCRDEEEWEDE